ncbi:DUF885 domain-containing protein [Pelomonas sp. CA6]|uniref:DUF885 domain-containing protein n=1 Tax=Pelomonas sp. CA6 TaxID=2907999 RepID=UPI001F4BD8F6|nr:DUF885 domain-containing protein [Pelomonas sp. CA6]MCH7344700.1 DUF885 domain-containing protein [Pelomonas sp. CA6]
MDRRDCHRTLLALATMALGARHAQAQAGPQASQPLARIAEAHFLATLELDPLMGSMLLGDPRYEGRLAITIAPEARARDRALQQRLLRQIAPLQKQADTLPESDRLTLQFLALQARDRLALLALPEHLLPINQYGGLPVQLAELASGQGAQTFAGALQYEGFLRRLQQLPAWNRQAIVNLRSGVAQGIVANRDLVERALPKLRELADADDERHPYLQPLRAFPATQDETQRRRWTRDYAGVLKTQLRPSLRALLRYLEQDYLPHTRDTAGLGALPGGAAWYAELVHQYTGTEMSPAQIHALGRQEVARLQAALETLRQQAGFRGSLAEFLRSRDWRPDLRPFTTEAEVLAAYAELGARVEQALPRLFERRPRAPLVVRPEPEISRNTASDHYVPPAADGSRPGVFFAVIPDPRAYERSGMLSLLLHEGQPGHHFHIARQMELPLPRVRRHGWLDVFGEGWALYAETLGYDMGLYQDDPVSHLGHLRADLHRAVRLVTDTGLHALGWSRAQSMRYMRDIEGLDEAEARRSTERYMAWPGQALAYKIGQLRLRQLRDQAQAALGAGFSLPAFHEQVLGEGCLPLPLLEARVRAWVAGQGGTWSSS